MKPKYQAPSLSGVYVPPVMASFADDHYQHNGLRGAEKSEGSAQKWIFLATGLAIAYLTISSFSEK